MAAFTHLNPEGSRFSDGSYGVYYAARSLETAIAEVGHHRAIFLRRTAEPAIDIDLRLVTATVEAELHDLLDVGAAGAAANESRFASVLDPDDYGASQSLGRKLREIGSWGLRWPSVRHAGGECVGIFRPRGAAPRQGGDAPGAALGRRAHQPLVREAGAARRRRLSAPRAAAPGVRASAGRPSVFLQLRQFLARVADRAVRREAHLPGDRPTKRSEAPRCAPIARRVTQFGWHAPCVPCRPWSTRCIVFVHLLAASMALGAIVATDLRLLSKLAQDRVRIAPPNEFVARIVMVALLLLYVTGGAIVAIGAFERADYLSNPKLQAKVHHGRAADAQRLRAAQAHLPAPGARPPRRALARDRLDPRRRAGRGLELPLDVRRPSSASPGPGTTRRRCATSSRSPPASTSWRRSASSPCWRWPRARSEPGADGVLDKLKRSLAKVGSLGQRVSIEEEERARR